ncbi:MAG: aspartate/glutamate racemase family protein [Variibacter sp.]
MPKSPRIVLLHATPVAMAPIQAAIQKDWPEAEAVNLLDDGLSIDRAKEPDEVSEGMIERFVDFGKYARRIGADGILVTCSAFGPAIERLAEVMPIPVVKPNEAMFEAALAQGKRIGMLATFAPSVPTMVAEFDEFVGSKYPDATLKTVTVPEAMTHLRKGDAETHNRLLAERAPELGDQDAIMLAHFSTSLAADAVRAKVTPPVLSAPQSAVKRMKSLIAG